MRPLEEFNHQIQRICTELFSVPPHKRAKLLQKKLLGLPAQQREIALNLVSVTLAVNTEPIAGMKDWEKKIMLAAGAVLIGVLLLIACLLPNPTAFQFFIFRIVIALSASAFGCVLPGFLHIESKAKAFALRAGGTLALFVLIYMVNPPQYITPPAPSEAANTPKVKAR